MHTSIIKLSALEKFPVAVHRDVHCDTKGSISYKSKFSNLTYTQVISITILVVVFTSVSLISLIRFIYPSNDLLSELSICHAAREVFNQKPFANSRRSLALDTLRVLFVWSGGISHNAYNLQTPLALMVMSKLPKI